MIETTDDMSIYIPKCKVGTPVFRVMTDNRIHKGFIKAYTVEYREIGVTNSHYEPRAYYTVYIQGYANGNYTETELFRKFFFTEEECAKAHVLEQYPYLFTDGKVLK